MSRMSCDCAGSGFIGLFLYLLGWPTLGALEIRKVKITGHQWSLGLSTPMLYDTSVPRSCACGEAEHEYLNPWRSML